MNVILDYGSGNLDSVKNGFEKAGIKTVISKDIEVIQNATSLVLPGVGAFGDAMTDLKKSGLIPYIKAHVNANKYLFGICLGMQLLFEKGYEYGVHDGLGLIKGDVKQLEVSRKVPHMGWNTLNLKQKNPVLKYIRENEYVYFVHSFYVETKSDVILASTSYEIKIPAIVNYKNIYATQFHPEKSGDVGMRILKAYKEIIQ